jgi:hypothetical protein
VALLSFKSSSRPSTEHPHNKHSLNQYPYDWPLRLITPLTTSYTIRFQHPFATHCLSCTAYNLPQRVNRSRYNHSLTMELSTELFNKMDGVECKSTNPGQLSLPSLHHSCVTAALLKLHQSTLEQSQYSHFSISQPSWYFAYSMYLRRRVIGAP